MEEYTFALIDIDYVLEEGKPVIRIFGRTKQGKSIVAFDRSFEPYFYALPKKTLEGAEKAVKGLKGDYDIVKVEHEKKIYRNREEHFLKVFTKTPGQVVPAREDVKRLNEVEDIFEADILFVKRYIVDKRLVPMGVLQAKGEKVESNLAVDLAVEISGEPKVVDEPLPELKVMAFDIEVYNPKGLGQPDRDPIMMISLASENFKKIISWKKKDDSPDYVEKVESEEAMLQRFCEVVKEGDFDILTAYNSDNFDLPYLRDRAKKLGQKLILSRDGSDVAFRSRGRYHAGQIRGRVHFDLYHYVSIILRGALQQIQKKTLSNIASTFLDNHEKGEIDWKNVDNYWNGPELNTLFKYSVNDAVVTKKLTDLFLPREGEISKLVRSPLFDCSRTTYGQLVENYLMWNAFERNEIVPNRPEEEERVQRAAFEAFEGAYVKEPEKGMHEDIALFDFRSLYPTIIISHNIDVSTIDCDCCKGSVEMTGETGHWFCKKRKGLMPIVLNNILNERIETKKKMKELKKDSQGYMILDNKQYALKILANSAYGYLAYRGSRWYTRAGASSVTSLGRMYIQKIIGIAGEFGLRTIYGDTDSLFVVAKEGKVGDKMRPFLEKVNNELPGVMELEFEGVFKRGIFVSKKRYAMIDDEGKTKVKGLEFVRKDWSPIAKETQKKVLDVLLKEGDAEKAFKVVREVVNRINKLDIKKDDLAVYTDLTRPLEKYEVTAPHIAVAKQMKRKGEDVRTGTTVGYIIKRGGGIISERARMVEEVNIKEIDKQYYIQNQIIPAVSRVMEALGYTEEDLLGKKQSKLTGFLK